MNLQEKIENIGKDLDYETGFFYDSKTGKILWEQKQGGEDIMDILPYVTKHDVSNAIWVHNHPPEFIGTYADWIPLSPNDIYTTAYFNGAGVIANDGQNLYSMFRPKNGWGKITEIPVKEFDKLWLQELRNLEKIDKEKVKNLKMSVEDYYHTGSFNRLNKVYQKILGLSMTMTPLKHPHFQNILGINFIFPENIPEWMKSSPKLMAKLKEELEYASEQIPELKNALKGWRTSVPQHKKAAPKKYNPIVRVNVRRMF